MSPNIIEHKEKEKEVVDESSYIGLKVIPNGDICFNSSDPSSYEKYIFELKQFIKPYEKINLGGKVINCDKQEREDDEICIIEKTWIYPCGNRDWGYSNGTPCIILYYSNDSNYRPIPYQSINDLPSEAPKELRNYLTEEVEQYGEFNSKLVYLYCTHAVYYDNYHPRGFYDFFFPTLNNVVDGYLPPIASVQFEFYEDYDYNDNLLEEEYRVECSLWSKTPKTSKIKNVSFKIKHGNCE